MTSTSLRPGRVFVPPSLSANHLRAPALDVPSTPETMYFRQTIFSTDSNQLPYFQDVDLNTPLPVSAVDYIKDLETARKTFRYHEEVAHYLAWVRESAKAPRSEQAWASVLMESTRFDLLMELPPCSNDSESHMNLKLRLQHAYHIRWGQFPPEEELTKICTRLHTIIEDRTGDTSSAISTISTGDSVESSSYIPQSLSLLDTPVPSISLTMPVTPEASVEQFRADDLSSRYASVDASTDTIPSPGREDNAIRGTRRLEDQRWTSDQSHSAGTASPSSRHPSPYGDEVEPMVSVIMGKDIPSLPKATLVERFRTFTGSRSAPSSSATGESLQSSQPITPPITASPNLGNDGKTLPNVSSHGWSAANNFFKKSLSKGSGKAVPKVHMGSDGRWPEMGYLTNTNDTEADGKASGSRLEAGETHSSSLGALFQLPSNDSVFTAAQLHQLQSSQFWEEWCLSSGLSCRFGILPDAPAAMDGTCTNHSHRSTFLVGCMVPGHIENPRLCIVSRTDITRFLAELLEGMGDTVRDRLTSRIPDIIARGVAQIVRAGGSAAPSPI